MESLVFFSHVSSIKGREGVKYVFTFRGSLGTRLKGAYIAVECNKV